MTHLDGDRLPEGVVPRRDGFTNTIRTTNWTDHLSAIPWIAAIPDSPTVSSCTARTVSDKRCTRKARFLYVDRYGNARLRCKMHTQRMLDGYHEHERLAEWQRRVSFETDRYDPEES